MNKAFRQGQIVKLIRNKRILTQEDLARELKLSQGIDTTQVTLSRDIRELKLMKGPKGYELPVVLDGEDDLPEIAGVLQDFALEVRQAQNLLIVLTTMGGAQPVAASIEDRKSVV